MWVKYMIKNIQKHIDIRLIKVFSKNLQFFSSFGVMHSSYCYEILYMYIFCNVPPPRNSATKGFLVNIPKP